MTHPHSLEFEVRDYECDLQGIVNNAVYQNYLEHARHKFLLSRNVDFAELTQQGIHLVVIRAEVDYKRSLTSGDQFVVHTHVERKSRLKFDFVQQIIRVADNALIVNARITGTSASAEGKPIVFDGLSQLLD